MNNLNFIGRKAEYAILEKCYKSNQSQLVIVYGRRRVGKTFLINQAFENNFAFKLTGVYNQSKQYQLTNFAMELNRKDGKERSSFKNWNEAFSALEDYLNSLPNDKKQVVFIDEMPWLDSQKSDFLPAFEFFWNNYGSAKNNLMLIVAGSASSWITNKLVCSKGGLFNRHSARLYLEPFTLAETKEYLDKNNMHWSNYDIAQLYMIMGGIPFYLNQLDSSLSLNENVDNIFFKEHGLLWDEFQRLYSTLFNDDERYIKVVETLSKNKYGLTRNEIAKKSGLSTNGCLSNILQNLIDSGFLMKTLSFSNRKEQIYQLCDFYTLFYFNFLKEHYGEEHYWNNSIDLPKRRNYLGVTFELLCKKHISQIKNALGISGVNSTNYSCLFKDEDEKKGSQIDLVIDRRDNLADLCEIKYSINRFEIDKDYHSNLLNKIDRYQKDNPRKSVALVLITTYGLKTNTYSNIVNKVITLNELFLEPIA